MKAIVTGSSKGLGKSIAGRLAHQGFQLSLIARSQSLLIDHIANLPNSHHHKAILFDLVHDDVTTLADEFHGTSVLINCAGITNHRLLFATSQQEIEDTIRLNLTVPILLSKLAYKPMIKQAKSPTETTTLPVTNFKPIIVNIGSVLSLPHYNVSGTSIYSALKAGLNGFTTSLSHEFKHKVRVVSILPGLIKDTDMGAQVSSDIKPVSLDTVVDKVMQVIYDQTINGEVIIVD